MNRWKEDPLLCFYDCPMNHGIDCAYLRTLLWTAAADNVDRQTIYGRTALSYAANSGCLDCVEDLLRRKASVHIQDSSGKSPLHYAVSSLSYDGSPNGPVITELLNAGANVQLRDKQGHTALFAFTKGREWSTNIFLMLVRAGACIHDKLEDGTTPLHHVTQIKQIEDFLAHGADANVQAADGSTPLMYLSSNRLHHRVDDQFQLIHTMLQYNPDLTRFNHMGFSALMQYFIGSDHRRCQSICNLLWTGNQKDLMRTSFTLGFLFYLIARRRCTACIDFLLSHELVMYVQNSEDQTPLQLAVARRNREMINHLYKNLCRKRKGD